MQYVQYCSLNCTYPALFVFVGEKSFFLQLHVSVSSVSAENSEHMSQIFLLMNIVPLKDIRHRSTV